MRRMRRRTHAVNKLYCATNGCTSFLETDLETATATCPICGYIRRVN